MEVKLRLLPSTWIVCESCEGDRYSDEVLWPRAALGGKEFSIADLYRVPLWEIRDLLAAEHPAAAPDSSIASALRILDALCDTGLGYLSLGRSSPNAFRRRGAANQAGQPIGPVFPGREPPGAG